MQILSSGMQRKKSICEESKTGPIARLRVSRMHVVVVSWMSTGPARASDVFNVDFPSSVLHGKPGSSLPSL